MTIENAINATRLVGKTVRPVPSSERHAHAGGKPRTGIVADVYIPDLNHPHLVVRYGNQVDYPYPFEVEVQLAA